MKSIVTTVIPTFNRVESLLRTIESVRRQTYTDVKILVLDNHSTDGTKDAIQNLMQIDPRIDYRRHEKNLGGFYNFNYGLEQVNTEYFSILSDDDIILPSFYENALREFQDNIEIGMVITEVQYCNKELINEGFSNSPLREGFYDKSKGLIEMITRLGRGPTWAGILFKSDVRDKIGLLDEETGATDFDYVYKVAANYPFIVNKEVSAVFFNHQDSASTRSGIDIFWPGFLCIINNINKFETVNEEEKKVLEELILRQASLKFIVFAKKSIKNRDYDQLHQIIELMKSDLYKSKFTYTWILILGSLSKIEFLWSLFNFLILIKRSVMNYLKPQSANKIQCEDYVIELEKSSKTYLKT